MLFPTADQYVNLIEEKVPGTWYGLSDYNFHRTSPGNIPPYIIGKSCLIFKAEKNMQQFAIRCFLNTDPETLNRYDQVCSYLSARKLPWKTDCNYMGKEIRFHGEQYPAVKMEWIEGQLLNMFIDRIISDPARLSRLQQDLITLSNSLEQNGIGHGDLNFSHILVKGDPTDFTIRLVDYDTMFIPTFGGQNSTVSGTPGFQHPARLASDYSESIDRFSIWILITGLEALKQDPLLWTQPERFGFRTDENMLFTFRDLLNPEKSRLFQHLFSYKNDALRYYVQQLETFCAGSSLNVVTHPEIYRSPVRPMQEERKGGMQIPQKLFQVEIKTIPSGRDVLVNGTKKGITPLRLSLAKEDFGHVEVLDAWERTPLQINEQVQTYEIDLLKKKKEERYSSPNEEPEIVDFSADHYSVMEGGIVSIRWKVKGNGKIHIDPIGDVSEKTGSREFVVNNTMQYELSIGNVKRSFNVHVQPKAKQKYLRSKMQTKPEMPERDTDRKVNTRLLVMLSVVVILSIAGYLVYSQFSGRKENNSANQFSIPPAVTTTPAFSVDAVKDFLNGLYAAYNRRNLNDMVSHYAEPVNEYYDSKSITTDSLSTILKDLFITPVYYSCSPDFSTLKVVLKGDMCSINVQTTEVLQKDANSKRDTFHTKISYVIDKDYRIVSEKTWE
ncbi:MAG: hypothetical protein ACJ75F_06060 [Flavisolibacter sp.]